MPTVYDPITIGKMVVKNRFAEAPTVKNFAKEDGRVNTRTLNNFELEADGPGLVIVTMSFTEDRGQVFRRQLGVQNDKAIAGLSDLANRIHKAGAKAALQISHGGNLCSEPIIGSLPVGPSEKPQWPGQKVHPLTTEETEAIIENYGKATARAKEAGFDAVELHACHGSLALQFLSPIQNTGRADKYAVRTTFLYETVAAMRRYVSPDFPLGVRLSCHEFMEEDKGTPGLAFDEVLEEIAPTLEKMGINWIHASAGRIGHTPDHAFPPLYEPRGVNVKFAESLKKKIHIPVITVGRLQDPKLIEKIIEEGRADMVAFCRPIIADPHLPKKMIESRYEDIRQCMACNWCLDRLFKQLGAECPMNPAYSWEKEYRLEPALKPKKVMVIGGGVSGLQAALTASQRGHKVTLYEKSDKLGGQVKLACAFPRLYTRELWNLPKWLIAQIEKSPVRVMLNTEVTPQMVEQEKPDTIVVATGARQKPAPKTNSSTVYLWDYLAGKAKIGKKVVILGGHEGAEGAVSLAREGKEVTLVEEGEEVAWPAYIYGGGARREPLMRYLSQAGVKILTQHKVKMVSEGEVQLSGSRGDVTVAAETILIALGREPEDNLYKILGTRGREVYLIGDAREVRSMPPASHEGFWVGRQII